jgi:hypothetical protein
MLRAVAVALVVAGVAAGADPDYDSARAKIASIEEDRAAPGSRIWLSSQELNAYGKREALEEVPRGLRDPRLVLGPGWATGSATVDLLKVRELKGPRPGGLLAWFLSGERPVEATANVQSGQGRATVIVQQATMSGVAVQGALLDFLISNFLLPFYPEAKIGRPFELKHNVERFEIGPNGVTVVIAGR